MVQMSGLRRSLGGLTRGVELFAPTCRALRAKVLRNLDWSRVALLTFTSLSFISPPFISLARNALARIAPSASPKPIPKLISKLLAGIAWKEREPA